MTTREETIALIKGHKADRELSKQHRVQSIQIAAITLNIHSQLHLISGHEYLDEAAKKLKMFVFLSRLHGGLEFLIEQQETHQFGKKVDDDLRYLLSLLSLVMLGSIPHPSLHSCLAEAIGYHYFYCIEVLNINPYLTYPEDGGLCPEYDRELTD